MRALYNPLKGVYRAQWGSVPPKNQGDTLLLLLGSPMLQAPSQLGQPKHRKPRRRIYDLAATSSAAGRAQDLILTGGALVSRKRLLHPCRIKSPLLSAGTCAQLSSQLRQHKSISEAASREYSKHPSGGCYQGYPAVHARRGAETARRPQGTQCHAAPNAAAVGQALSHEGAEGVGTVGTLVPVVVHLMALPTGPPLHDPCTTPRTIQPPLDHLTTRHF